MSSTISSVRWLKHWSGIISIVIAYSFCGLKSRIFQVQISVRPTIFIKINSSIDSVRWLKQGLSITSIAYLHKLLWSEGYYFCMEKGRFYVRISVWAWIFIKINSSIDSVRWLKQGLSITSIAYLYKLLWPEGYYLCMEKGRFQVQISSEPEFLSK